MAARLFGLLPNFFSHPAELQIDVPEPRVHRSFKLGNRHGFTRSAHLSIVVYAMTMHDGDH